MPQLGPALMPLLIGTGAAVGMAAVMNSGPKAPSAPIPLPQPPSVDQANAAGSATGNRRAAAVSQSVFTNPLGVAGTADVNRKTLLGQ